MSCPSSTEVISFIQTNVPTCLTSELRPYTITWILTVWFGPTLQINFLLDTEAKFTITIFEPKLIDIIQIPSWEELNIFSTRAYPEVGGVLLSGERLI